MARLLRGIDLPWLVFGRSVRPFHLAVTVSMLVLAINNFFTEDTPLSTTLWGDIVGSITSIVTIIMVVAWVIKSDKLSEWGLLLATGVWTYRATVYLLAGEQGHIAQWFNAFGLSIAWIMGCGGAWLLERYERHYQEILHLRRLMRNSHQVGVTQNGMDEGE